MLYAFYNQAVQLVLSDGAPLIILSYYV